MTDTAIVKQLEKIDSDLDNSGYETAWMGENGQLINGDKKAEKYSRILALLQQSNREYADKIIGKDQPYRSNIPDIFIDYENAIRAELREKNNPDPDTGGDK